MEIIKVFQTGYVPKVYDRYITGASVPLHTLVESLLKHSVNSSRSIFS